MRWHKCQLCHKHGHKEKFCLPLEATPLNQIQKLVSISLRERKKNAPKRVTFKFCLQLFKFDFEPRKNIYYCFCQQGRKYFLNLTQLQVLLWSHEPSGNKLTSLAWWKQITLTSMHPVTRFLLIGELISLFLFMKNIFQIHVILWTLIWI